MSGFQTFLACDLWDLVDEGIDAVLERAKGEAGITGITVTVLAPAVARFRPHLDVSPRTFRCTAGLHFHPDPQAYHATRIRPVVSDWLHSRDPLAKVAEACTRQGLTWRARFDLDGCADASTRHDSCKVKDAFGELHPTHLCPSNPDVREFWRAAMQNVSEQYNPAAIELAGLTLPQFSPIQKSAYRAIRGNPAALLLADSCFCESCQQAAMRAGLDAAGAARSAKVHLERILSAGGYDIDNIEKLDRDELLRGYYKLRVDLLSSLSATIKASAKGGLMIEQAFEPGSFTLPRAGDGVIVRQRERSPEDAADVACTLTKKQSDFWRVELKFEADAQEPDNSAALVRAAGHAATGGIHTLHFENYGMLPLASLDGIRKAVRFASRESD